VVEKKSIGLKPGPATSAPQHEFVATVFDRGRQQLPAAGDIRIELRRGARPWRLAGPRRSLAMAPPGCASGCDDPGRRGMADGGANRHARRRHARRHRYGVSPGGSGVRMRSGAPRLRVHQPA